MLVQIIRDQAVWERETFFVEVPDGLKGIDLEDAISEAEDSYCGYTDDPAYSKEVLDDPVYSISTERKYLIDGVEFIAQE